MAWGYGGISIKDNLRSHSLNEYSCVNDVLEINTVRVALAGNLHLNIMGIYRPPSHLMIPAFNVHVGQALTTFRGSAPVYVVEDINIDLLHECGSHSDFIEKMRGLSFVLLITICPRGSPTPVQLY